MERDYSREHAGTLPVRPAAEPEGRRRGRGRRPWLLVTLAFLIAPLAFLSSRQSLHVEHGGRAGGELMYFPSGHLLHPMALGHPLTLADCLWLRAIQYYGEHRLSDNRFPMAGHIFETVTALDPHFTAAYIFGGLVLAAEGGDLERGLALLKRGIAWNPRSWELPFETGFVYYVTSKDDLLASHYFGRASRLPEAPSYVKRFAAHTKAKSGDLQAALALWEELLDSTDHPAVQALAAERVAEIRAALALGTAAQAETRGENAKEQ